MVAAGSRPTLGGSPMPDVVFRSPNDAADAWGKALSERLPGLDFRAWPNIGDPADVGFALVWKAAAEFLKQFPNMKAICSLGQGVRSEERRGGKEFVSTCRSRGWPDH